MFVAVLLAPLIGFLINALGFQKASCKVSGAIATSACLISFLALLILSFSLGGEGKSFVLLPWFQLGDLNLNFSFVLDPLSFIMGFLITGVGTLIHLYSMGYMEHDKGACRYFAYLNLFVFMMLILVFADNLPVLFVGWEGVGLCSYLLIGFWFKENKKVSAGMMAFLANRIGDAGFLLGIFFLFLHFGSSSFSDFSLALNLSEGDKNHLALGALFLFLGATGKSAQIPLYFWLPSAMAGPTPVSALIHAATMVTAGVYLLVRLSPLYSLFPHLLLMISWIGAFTALGAGLVAMKQWDFKKILAYSTISQLAYLFMAIGVKAFSAGIFHLLTHGFFKALLFLCAGSVIHALNGEQDIRKMGGLRKSMPITFFTYLVGASALMALPPFSGFFSKDEILWSLFSSGNYALFALAFFTGLCTVFYMTRLSFFVFFAPSRSSVTAREGPWTMKLPLIVLALLSLFGGLLGIPHLLYDRISFLPPHIIHKLLNYLSPLSFKGSELSELILILLSVLSALAVIVLSARYYLKDQRKKQSPALGIKFLEEAFFVEKALEQYVQAPFIKLSRDMALRIEERGFHQVIPFLIQQFENLKKLFSVLQNGNVQSYALFFVWGLAFFIFLLFIR